MTLVEWTQVATLAAGAVVTLFMLIYMVIACWWKSQEGQTVIMLSFLIGMAAAIGVVRRNGAGELADAMGLVVWSGVVVVYLWMIHLLLRAQKISYIPFRRHTRSDAVGPPETQQEAEE